LLVFGNCRSTYFALCLLHIAPAFQELEKGTFICFVGCSKCSRPKYIWRNHLPPCNKCFLNGLRLWVIWRTARTRDLCNALSRHSNVHGWLRTALTKGHQSFCLINKCTKNIWLQCNLLEFKDCYCVLIQRNYFSVIDKAAMASVKRQFFLVIKQTLLVYFRFL
jgi:hypothetical protein